MAVQIVESIPEAYVPRGSAPTQVQDADVEYLDLDGDGLPDAVRITETRILQCALDGGEEVAQIIVRLEASIDVDGVPATVETNETLGIHLGSHHHGDTPGDVLDLTSCAR